MKRVDCAYRSYRLFVNLLLSLFYWQWQPIINNVKHISTKTSELPPLICTGKSIHENIL